MFQEAFNNESSIRSYDGHGNPSLGVENSVPDNLTSGGSSLRHGLVHVDTKKTKNPVQKKTKAVHIKDAEKPLSE